MNIGQAAHASGVSAKWRDASRHSADVKEVATAHMAALRERIESLSQMVGTLETLTACCAGDDRPECPILADLEEPSGEPVPALRPSRAERGILKKRGTQSRA